MRKLSYFEPGTLPVTTLDKVFCSFCLEIKECVTPVAVPSGLVIPFLCIDCAKESVRILKRHGVIPGQTNPLPTGPVATPGSIGTLGSQQAGASIHPNNTYPNPNSGSNSSGSF